MKVRERFLQVYANLPLGVRDEIVCVVEKNQSVSWNAANLEVVNETDLGKKILAILDELKII